MNTSFEFNRIYIIESLKKNEDPTGQKLFEDIKIRAIKHIGLSVWFSKVFNKVEFKTALANILSESQIGTKPLIHLELHGSKYDGLFFESGESMSWQELVDLLREINFITKNNLCLVLACCFGGELIRGLDFEQKTPIYSFLGSFEEVMPFQLLKFTEFYDEILESGNMALALKKLNDNNFIDNEIEYIKSEQLFDLLWKKIEDDYNNEDNFKKNLNKHLSEALKSPSIIANHNILLLRSEIAFAMNNGISSKKNISRKAFLFI